MSLYSHLHKYVIEFQWNQTSGKNSSNTWKRGLALYTIRLFTLIQVTHFNGQILSTVLTKLSSALLNQQGQVSYKHEKVGWNLRLQRDLQTTYGTATFWVNCAPWQILQWYPTQQSRVCGFEETNRLHLLLKTTDLHIKEPYSWWVNQLRRDLKWDVFMTTFQKQPGGTQYIESLFNWTP